MIATKRGDEPVGRLVLLGRCDMLANWPALLLASRLATPHMTSAAVSSASLGARLARGTQDGPAIKLITVCGVSFTPPNSRK